LPRDGDLLADDKAARKQGKIIAREMLADPRRYGRNLKHWVFAITNKRGRAVGRVVFSSLLPKEAAAKTKSALARIAEAGG
jgi:hypothetical protein